MISWRISLALTLLLASLSGCRPADTNVKTLKERLETGELVIFSEPGYRRPGCRKTDWNDIRLFEFDSVRQSIVIGEIKSIPGPGLNPCFRVGSVVNLTSDVFPTGNGLVRVEAIGLQNLEALRPESLSGSLYQKDRSAFNNAKDGLRRNLHKRPWEYGVVNIVYFTYIENSATDETSIRLRAAR